MSSRKWRSPAALVLTLLFTLLAACQEQRPGSQPLSLAVVPAFSNVGFSIMEFGVMRQEGSFRDFRGDIYYDPAHPERSHVSFVVQVDSIDARSRHREEALRSDDFFDTQRFPTMSFTSTAVAARPDGTLAVTGDLTIRGVSKRITIPVRYLGFMRVSDQSSYAGFESTFTLDRTEFGVNGARWQGGRLLLSKEVTITLQIGARPAGQ
ncbi:MAG TPA: YceI family protein [Terriglobales bacterium]|nr:YceI family protein [Terriglobales bacterium]